MFVRMLMKEWGYVIFKMKHLLKCYISLDHSCSLDPADKKFSRYYKSILYRRDGRDQERCTTTYAVWRLT